MIHFTLQIVDNIGEYYVTFARFLTQFLIFACSAIGNIFISPHYWSLIWKNVFYIGFYSIPVVAFTAIFSGAVLALQSYIGFSRFSAEGAIANVLVLSITRELGPVMTGLMIAGRVGAGFASEIGAMKVSNQIDALVSLSTHPIRYLVTPKLIAAIFVLPLLVIMADILGIMGGYLVSIYKLDFNSASYITQTLQFVEWSDILSGIFKSIVFGILITLISCYQGFKAENGAQGVGKVTTYSVVLSSISILFFNYLLTELFFLTSY